MGLHILFSPETTTEREREQLAGLTKNERRYLSRRGWVCVKIRIEQIDADN